MHGSSQNVQCRGCNKVFAKGSGLLLHFEQNACKPLQSFYMADSNVHGKLMLESNRAMLALQMEQLVHKENAKRALLHGNQSAVGTSAASESEGGVRLQPSIMDDLPSQSTHGSEKDGNSEFENLIEYASMRPVQKDNLQKPLVPISSCGQSVTETHSSGDSTATAKALGKYPTLQPQNKPSNNAQSDAMEQNLLSGMDNMSVSGSVIGSVSGSVKSSGSGPWGMGSGSVWGNASQKLFPNAPPTPAPAPADIDIDHLKSIDVGEDAAQLAGMRGTFIKQSPVDGLYYCPFPGCKYVFPSPLSPPPHHPLFYCFTIPVYSPTLTLTTPNRQGAKDVFEMIAHIQTHRGLDNRCSGCLRVFGSASALVAHMESPSTRCNIRTTRGYSNAIHIVSGGFLGAYGRLEDGTVKLESQKRPESFW